MSEQRSSLYGPNGKPLFFKGKASKGNSSPILGPGIAPGWNQEPKINGYSMPQGKSSLQFNTDLLTLPDYRMMRDHYQVNSSLSVLMFMIHQSDWKIIGGEKKVRDHVDENISGIWTRLVRAMSQAFWAGFSPCATEWENVGSKVMLTKVKDLSPEMCEINWKKIPAKGSGKKGSAGTVMNTPVEKQLVQWREVEERNGKGGARIFDGIKQYGYDDVPVSNSFWYPALMENGNMYGKKILNPAYQSWFFSLLMHMYSNRYFERFGEPVPVARAPYDEEITVGGQAVNGNELMKTIARQFRNGSAVVLPNDRVMNGSEDTNMFEYSLEFLESQLRGADFDRYLQRLDEEISVALFTPLLITRTADGGSFNLGVGHMKIFQMQINAILQDWAEYINQYLIKHMVGLNFGYEAEMPRIEFRTMGRTDPETVRSILQTVVGAGAAKVDLQELGDAAGLTLEETDIIIGKPEIPEGGTATGGDPAKPGDKTKVGTDKRTGRPERAKAPKGDDKKGPAKVAAGIADRVTGQFKAGRQTPDVGFKVAFTGLIEEMDLPETYWSADAIYQDLESGIAGVYSALAELDNTSGVSDEDVRSAILAYINNNLVRVENDAAKDLQSA